MSQLDIFSGDVARDEGIAKVIGNTPPEWGEQYRRIIAAYFDKMEVGTRFRGENFRVQCLFFHPELAKPHHPNVWGAHARSVINALLREERIRVVGLSKALMTTCHSHAYALYEKLR